MKKDRIFNMVVATDHVSYLHRVSRHPYFSPLHYRWEWIKLGFSCFADGFYWWQATVTDTDDRPWVKDYYRYCLYECMTVGKEL